MFLFVGDFGICLGVLWIGESIVGADCNIALSCIYVGGGDVSVVDIGDVGILDRGSCGCDNLLLGWLLQQSNCILN